jgi:hypothetical protein
MFMKQLYDAFGDKFVIELSSLSPSPSDLVSPVDPVAMLQEMRAEFEVLI